MNRSIKRTRLRIAFAAKELSTAISAGLFWLSDKLDSYSKSYSEYLCNRKAITELTELDERMLTDIGINRTDIARIATADNPSCELQRLNRDKPKCYSTIKTLHPTNPNGSLSPCC